MLDMSAQAHWLSQSAVIEYLAKQLVRGRLSLFLGAGISFNFGLPLWDKLLERLCNDCRIAFPPSGYPSNPTQLTLATEIRGHYADTASFLKAVRTQLYSSADVSFSSLASDKTFVSLGALAMASSRGGIASIVTTNYDDCLESYLEGCGFVVDSVSTPAHWSSRADISIYHPHGFLPYVESRGLSPDLVLDQISFSEVINRRDSPWYQKIVTILRNSTVLMIGFGAGDQNLLAMLQNSGEEHPRELDRVKYRGVLLQTSPNPSSVATYQRYGICTTPIADYTHDLPRFIYEICQVAAGLRRSELGIC